MIKKEFYVEMVRNGMRKELKVWANSMFIAKRLFEKQNQKQIKHIQWRVVRSRFDLAYSPFGYDESLVIDKFMEERLEQMVERLVTLIAASPKPKLEHLEPKLESVQEEFIVQEEPMDELEAEFMFL